MKYPCLISHELVTEHRLTCPPPDASPPPPPSIVRRLVISLKTSASLRLQSSRFPTLANPMPLSPWLVSCCRRARNLLLDLTPPPPPRSSSTGRHTSPLRRAAPPPPLCLWDMGRAVSMALGFGRERERVARKRREGDKRRHSPFALHAPPDTRLYYWGRSSRLP